MNHSLYFAVTCNQDMFASAVIFETLRTNRAQSRLFSERYVLYQYDNYEYIILLTLYSVFCFSVLRGKF